MLAVESAVPRAPVDEDSLFQSAEDVVSESGRRLDECKRRVPAVRARVGDAAWTRMVATSESHSLARAPKHSPAVNRAYYKMQEMMLSCALQVPARTVHLCEAPGGFVQAVAEDAPPAWEWRALTIATGPAPSPRLPPGGHFVFADVRDVQQRAVLCDQGWAMLVTADGATEMDHDRLEEEHWPLLRAQTEMGLWCLGEGGVFVVKFFEGLHVQTQTWIALLTTRFESVSLIKPITSRPTNSERYLVARGFAGDRSPLRPCTVCETWMRTSLRPVVDRMAAAQAEALSAVLSRAA